MHPLQRLLVADDHALFRHAIKKLMADAFPEVEIFLAANGAEAVEFAQAKNPELILLDLDMPLLNGFEAATEILRNQPQARILILSMHRNPEYANRALKLGCLGYMIKDSAPEELIIAIKAVQQGRQYISYQLANALLAQDRTSQTDSDLSERETEVTRLLCLGKSNKEIAFDLNISRRTVEAHRARIMQKLSMDNLPALVVYAIKKGIITTEEDSLA